MNKMCIKSKFVVLFALVLSAVGELNASATAVKNTTTGNRIQKSESTAFQSQGNFQVAQAAIVGQCRAAKARIFVYPERSTSSQSIRTIGRNEQVTLADNGAAGWIAISAPVAGYVRASDLALCQGANRPTPNPAPDQPTTSLCRIVTYNGPEGGLAIRSQPNKSGPRVGGARLGERVTLRTSPPPTTLDKDGRAWVEVTAPTTGWISYGYPNSRSTNIGACP